MTKKGDGALVVAALRHHTLMARKVREAARITHRGTRMTNPNRTETAALARILATLAEGDLHERMRLEQAARVIVAARRAARLGDAGAIVPPSASDSAVQAVTEIARHWDDTAVTAVEYAEGLPGVALDRLLRAAPAWAAAFTAAPDRLAA